LEENFVKQLSLKMLDKKLEKKNSELVEVRDFRKKLDDKEKEICAAIDKLQNQKVEIIFAQVKKEIKNKNLDISSASVLTIVDALKNNQQILNDEENSLMEEPETELESEEILPKEKTEIEISEENDGENFFSRLNSISADKASDEK